MQSWAWLLGNTQYMFIQMAKLRAMKRDVRFTDAVKKNDKQIN